MTARRGAGGMKETVMPYDLWSLNPGNAISETDDETEMRRLVAELIAIGWSADDLSLDGPGWEHVLEGAALAAWVEG